MSTYYIKQKTFNVQNKYFIYDKDEKPIFEVVEDGFTGIANRFLGSIFSFSQNLIVKNIDGTEAFIIHKKSGFVFEKYDIFSHGNEVASISLEKTMLVPNVFISTKDSNYMISTDPLTKHFLIQKDGVTVGEIKKKVLSFADTYELCVYEDEKAQLFIAATICIDNAFYNK